MRVKQMKPRASDRSREGQSARTRSQPDRDGAASRSRMPGLRWVPAPLAVLVAAIGALVIGSLQGQVAAANANQAPRYQAGGILLKVGAINWMDDSMTGQPTKKGSKSQGYSMPSSEMPGMQEVGDNRLRVEVDLSNVSSDRQRYSIRDFTLVGPGGKVWHVDSPGNSSQPAAANLQPGFGTIIDMYFDMPAKNSHHLTIRWSHDGTTISIPANTGTVPGGMHM